jgi:hypothetical protein
MSKFSLHQVYPHPNFTPIHPAGYGAKKLIILIRALSGKLITWDQQGW